MTSLNDINKLINKKISDFSSTQLKNYTNSYNNFVVEVNSKLPNYATKTDLNLYVPMSKYTSDVSQFALKSDIKPFPDISQYALKTDIKPFPDVSQYALKSELKPFPDVSQYALKSELKPFPDVSQYALKSEIKPFPDVSQFALKSDLKLIPDSSQFIIKNENIQLPKKVQIELGSDDAKTQNKINDGKIVYKGWSSGLDIVGVSDGVLPTRNVRIWDALNTGTIQANNIILPNKSTMEFGAGETKEVSAGRIGYKTWTDGLDIVGAGTIAGQRKVRVWDKLDTDVLDVTDINVRGVLKDKSGNKYVNTKDLNEKQPVCRTVQTELNDDGKGNYLNLDRHNLECKTNEYLNGFRLKRNTEGTKIQWVGKCCSAVW